ncbi:MAG: aminoglycoside 6-adenylyltransferase [Chloroflexi bacterium]|nr:aminoglycoside 6-adenylyltransferase [Chloroflexota bacterium]
MRSEQEMLELILNTARHDARIRAVIMNGSRTNPNARRDIFQDFDIVYVVTAVDPFQADPTWINRFGELMILQMPEAMEDPPPQNNGSFIYLMQFLDGNRIDLGLFPLAKLSEWERDSLSLLLLDKDGIVEPFAPPSENDYLPKPPTAKQFADCCNEFWWMCPYVAKGLWREEIIYAKFMFDQHIREQLMKMLTWHIGVQTGFARSPGKLGKRFKQFLAPELWALLEQSYADASTENTWAALFATCQLFRTTAVHVATHFCFDYPSGDDEKVRAHLQRVRVLPKNATDLD